MKPINFVRTYSINRSVQLWGIVTLSASFLILCGALWILVPQCITLKKLFEEKNLHAKLTAQLNNTVTENTQKKLAVAELKRRVNRIERLTKNPRFPLENLTFMASILHADLGIQSVTWQGKSLTAILTCSTSDTALHAVQALKKSGHFNTVKLVALTRNSGAHSLQATIQGDTRLA